MRPDNLPPELTSPRQALDLGYEEGCGRRVLGAKDHHLDEDRAIWLENMYGDERSPRNRFYEAWRLGFDAGYLGHPKPFLCAIRG
jgi:hypothetical protein